MNHIKCCSSVCTLNSGRQLMSSGGMGDGGGGWTSSHSDMVNQSIAATRQMLSSNVHLTSEIASLDHNGQHARLDQSDDLIMIADPKDEAAVGEVASNDEDVCLATFG